MIAAPRARRGGHWPRRVAPERLDELPADDPLARRSRRDLQLLNRIMGARGLLLGALDPALDAPRPRLIELGGGDGSLMLRLARSRARRWPGASVTLVDLKPAVDADTLAAIRAHGWSVEIVTTDVLDWLARPVRDTNAVIFANLFLHHFTDDKLASLLAGIARRSRCFVCCEPRRSRTALAGSCLLGLIGCNSVTRHDAVVSVHAGFRDRELSAAWPRDEAGIWRLDETSASVFSHLFVAARSR